MFRRARTCIRAFVRLRELAATYGDLAKRLSELEEKTEALVMSHDTFSRNTRNQLKRVFDALRELMTPPYPPRRPIGFVTHEDKGSKKASGQAKGKVWYRRCCDLPPTPRCLELFTASKGQSQRLRGPRSRCDQYKGITVHRAQPKSDVGLAGWSKDSSLPSLSLDHFPCSLVRHYQVDSLLGDVGLCHTRYRNIYKRRVRWLCESTAAGHDIP